MPAQPTEICTNVVVGVEFTMRDAEGAVLDSSEEDGIVYYLAGHENVVPGLEKALFGRRVGDHLQVVVPPEEGYGLRDENLPPIEIPLDELGDKDELELGTAIDFETDEGILEITFIGIRGEVALFDANDSLAGVELHFDVTVRSIRAATADELKHGHPHGADGHEGH